MKIEFFNLSKNAEQMESTIGLINVIKKTVIEFEVCNDISIKFIGFEGDLTSPKLLLFDLILKKEYYYEINLFSIRITKHGYEVLTNEEEYKISDFNSIYGVVFRILSNSYYFEEKEKILRKPHDLPKRKSPFIRRAGKKFVGNAGTRFVARANKRVARKAETKIVARAGKSVGGKVEGIVERDVHTGRYVRNLKVNDKNIANIRQRYRGLQSKDMPGKLHVKGQNIDTNKPRKFDGKHEHRH